MTDQIYFIGNYNMFNKDSSGNLSESKPMYWKDLYSTAIVQELDHCCIAANGISLLTHLNVQ